VGPAAPSQPSRRTWTAEELLELPDDGLRHELLEGELVPVTPAGFEHGDLAMELAFHVKAFVRERSLGVVLAAETGFVLRRDPDTVRAPDVAFVRADRVPPRDQRRRFAELAPDLVAEVVSPADRAGEVNGKVAQWLDAGVRLVWVVDPENRAVVAHEPGGVAHLLRDGDELDGGDVLPGFRLPLAELFAGTEPSDAPDTQD
jgi:Uma2 family endonuclease